MAHWIMPPVAGLIEPAPAPEITIDDVGAIEMIGAETLRVWYTVEQLPIDIGGLAAQQVVVLKMRRSLAGVPAALARLRKCVASGGLPGDVRRAFFPRLVE